jgi:hypothetical protein
MNNGVPEEIEAMAYLLGQSKQIDSMMMERNKELITDSSTIKAGIDQYIQAERALRQQMISQPVVGVPSIPNHIGQPYVETQPLPQIHNTPQQNVVYPPDDRQLEFNLTPNQGDLIINLLKEISIKLTKQNSLLEKIYAKNQTEEKPIALPVKKLIQDK